MTKQRYAWVVVGLLWVVGFFNYLDRQVLFSVFALLRSNTKLSDTQLETHPESLPGNCALQFRLAERQN